MSTLLDRDVVPFQTEANGSVLINGAVYNKTILDLYNFTMYSNNTLSNSSGWCYLTLSTADSMPIIFPNGSIVNGTSCYIPYYGMGQRGEVGIAFAVLFGISIMFTLVCLKKHGQMFLPQEKRFRAVGRRWPWYWALFVAACGLISSISAIDVDRYYLPSSPIVIQTIFWYLMLPGVLAIVWESVRHWGSWQERQRCDEDAFALRQDDRRSKVEFYLPLIFYLFAWLNFFLNIPRNWLGFQAQADPSQISSVAIPAAADPRFKAGAILAFIAWLVIPFSLWHSIRHYKPHARARFLGSIRAVPPIFFLTIPLALISVGYAEAQGWLWMINLGSETVNAGYLYGFGYGPPVLILYFNIMAGLHYPNEDLELIRQRLVRGEAIDAELGINRRARKPWWWTKVANEIGMDNDAKLRALAGEVRGVREARERIGQNFELRNLAQQHLDEDRDTAPARNTEFGVVDSTMSPFRDDFDDVENPHGRTDESPDQSTIAPTRGPIQRENSMASFGSQTTLASTNLPRPQHVRSMLDV